MRVEKIAQYSASFPIVIIVQNVDNTLYVMYKAEHLWSLDPKFGLNLSILLKTQFSYAIWVWDRFSGGVAIILY